MEAAGIEPASKNRFIQLSPSAADALTFPYSAARRQAALFGISYTWQVRKSSLRMFTAALTPLPGRGAPGLDGSLIRLRKQL